MRTFQVHFCCLPGVTIAKLRSNLLVLLDDSGEQRGLPMVIDLVTGEAGWLTSSGKLADSMPAPHR